MGERFGTVMLSPRKHYLKYFIIKFSVSKHKMPFFTVEGSISHHIRAQSHILEQLILLSKTKNHDGDVTVPNDKGVPSSTISASYDTVSNDLVTRYFSWCFLLYSLTI